MKSKIFIALSFFYASSLLFAQGLIDAEGRPTSDLTSSMLNNGAWVSTSTRTSDPVEGSPYLFDTFFNKSKVYFQNDVYSINRLNYNLKSEQFEAQISEDSIFILNTRFVKKVIMNGKTLEPYYNPEETNLTFYENMGEVNGKVLLKENYLTVKEGRVDPMTKVKVGADKYMKNEHYYIGDTNGKIIKKIKLKKSDVLSLFAEDIKSQVTSYVKQNKLKLSDPEDVMKLIYHFNQSDNKQG
ncbi:MAG: hypothetical protein KDD16_00240 [Mangrovimonas sp.]|nr:hypothetical protein [Mangrovimonas sp.]